MKLADAQSQFNNGKLIALGEYRTTACVDRDWSKNGKSGTMSYLRHFVEVGMRPYEFEQMLPKGQRADAWKNPFKTGQKIVVQFTVNPHETARGAFRIGVDLQPLE